MIDEPMNDDGGLVDDGMPVEDDTVDVEETGEEKDMM